MMGRRQSALPVADSRRESLEVKDIGNIWQSISEGRSHSFHLTTPSPERECSSTDALPNSCSALSCSSPMISCFGCGLKNLLS